MNRIKLTLVFVIFISVALSHAGNFRYGIINKPAPSWGVAKWYQLPDKKTSLDVVDYKGKVIYLYGFQSWCPGCHSHGFPTLQKLITHYKGNPNVGFVAIQTVFEGFKFNTVEKAVETAKRYDLDIPVGHSGSAGEKSSFMQTYRSGGTPWSVIIDKKGVVRYNDFHIKTDKAIEIIDRLIKNK